MTDIGTLSVERAGRRTRTRICGETVRYVQEFSHVEEIIVRSLGKFYFEISSNADKFATIAKVAKRYAAFGRRGVQKLLANMRKKYSEASYSEALENFSRRLRYRTKRKLFGGAMSLMLPERFIDVSRFRVVPDAQEVFTDARTDETVIVEILEHQKDAKDAVFFFDDISDQNSATEKHIERQWAIASDAIPLIDERFPKMATTGLQRVVKFRESEDAGNLVRVTIVVLRLEHVNADVVVSFTSPVFLHPLSSSSRIARPSIGQRGDDSSPEAIFFQSLRSFEILDWGLFA